MKKVSFALWEEEGEREERKTDLSHFHNPALYLQQVGRWYCTKSFGQFGYTNV